MLKIFETHDELYNCRYYKASDFMITCQKNVSQTLHNFLHKLGMMVGNSVSSIFSIVYSLKECEVCVWAISAAANLHLPNEIAILIHVQ